MFDIMMGIVEFLKNFDIDEFSDVIYFFLDVVGIVMIDEIGVYLYLRWKMCIVKMFKWIFFKMSFIIIIYELFCLRGFKKGEVVVL